MKKIFILYEFFNGPLKFFPSVLESVLNYIKKKKLKSLIYSLFKKYGSDIDVEIISKNNKKLIDLKNVAFKSFSDIRVNLERKRFLEIKTETIKFTKNIFRDLFKNFQKIPIFYLENKTLYIPKLLEFDIINYFNVFFGCHVIIREYVKEKTPDILILYNCHSFSLKFFKNIRNSKSNTLHHEDSFFIKSRNILKMISFSNFILFLIGAYFKSKFKNIYRSNKIYKNYVDNNIIFAVKTRNQFKSVKPVYNSLKGDFSLNPIYYFIETYLDLKDLSKVLTYVLNKQRNLLTYRKKLSLNIRFHSTIIKDIFNIFENSQFFMMLTLIYIYKLNLTRFTGNNIPSLVVVANDFMAAERVVVGFFKSINIPSLFIPHAAIPIIEEFVSKSDIGYYTLGGELDKSYYMSKEIPGNNIEVVGIPRYENLYKGKIDKLNSVKDMFNSTSYNFSKKKFTIVLTTNPIDDKSNEKIITSVINSLKQLNLIDNLIIKLHPHESGKIHRETLQKLKVNPVIVKSYNILDILKSSDLLISQKSTTLLEAMIIGTPMILLDFTNKSLRESSKYGFLDENFIPTVKDQEMLTQEIKNLIDVEGSNIDYRLKQKQFAAKFSYYDLNEPPIQKIVKFILKIVKK